MRRDWELIRRILLALEEYERTDGAVRPDDFEGYDSETVSYHMWLLKQAGLIEATCRDQRYMKIQCIASRLTWEGHEFLDKIRSKSIWNDIIKIARDKGLALSYDSIRMIASILIKKVLSQ